MYKSYLRIIISTAIIAAVLFIINILLYQIPNLNAAQGDFIYPLPVTYLFFLVFSVIILGILVRISLKNKEQIGYAFLLLTGVKMALSYLLARPIIAKTAGSPTEKVNFFAVFILFLAIEAYHTARLLNNKQ